MRIHVVSWNANGLNDRKRKEIIEVFKKKEMDVLGVQETHMRGSGRKEDNKRRVWKRCSLEERKTIKEGFGNCQGWRPSRMSG